MPGDEDRREGGTDIPQSLVDLADDGSGEAGDGEATHSEERHIEKRITEGLQRLVDQGVAWRIKILVGEQEFTGTLVPRLFSVERNDYGEDVRASVRLTCLDDALYMAKAYVFVTDSGEAQMIRVSDQTSEDYFVGIMRDIVERGEIEVPETDAVALNALDALRMALSYEDQDVADLEHEVSSDRVTDTVTRERAADSFAEILSQACILGAERDALLNKIEEEERASQLVIVRRIADALSPRA